MSDPASDEDLMRAFQGGDARAFDTLYRRYRGSLYRFLVRQCGNEATGDELYQDVWMTLVRQRERWEPTASLKTYLYRIAHSRLVDHYRRNNRQGGFLHLAIEDAPEIADTCALSAADAEWQRANVAESVRRCLDALPAEQREAFLLKEESELDLAQVAAATGVAPEAAKSRIRYAIRKLRQCLEALV